MSEDELPRMMREAAKNFISIFQRQHSCLELPAPPVPAHVGPILWLNTLFRATAFRRGHVELFEVPGQFAVVHVCVTPHTRHEAAIFGFDMIAGRAQATGMFLDFSPVTIGHPSPSLSNVVDADVRAGFRQHRQRPDWGSIFSDDFFAIRPADRIEVCRAMTLALEALDYYLLCVRDGCPSSDGLEASNPLVLQGQSAYAIAQRKNPHTFRVLARLVGAKSARNFIDDVLFPMPECA